MMTSVRPRSSKVGRSQTPQRQRDRRRGRERPSRSAPRITLKALRRRRHRQRHTHAGLHAERLEQRRLLAFDFAAAYANADVILTPTSPTVAFPFGAKTDDPLTMYLCDIFTSPTNLAGHPAMSVPFVSGQANMPVGVQILAPTLGEEAMFKVAAVLESAA